MNPASLVKPPAAFTFFLPLDKRAPELFPLPLRRIAREKIQWSQARA